MSRAAPGRHCVHDALAADDERAPTKKSQELVAAVERFAKTS